MIPVMLPVLHNKKWYILSDLLAVSAVVFKIVHAKTLIQGSLYQPDIFQHVQNLGGQVGVLHVKLGQVSLQQTGRRLLGLQGRGLPPDTQDPKTHTAQNYDLGVFHYMK